MDKASVVPSGKYLKDSPIRRSQFPISPVSTRQSHIIQVSHATKLTKESMLELSVKYVLTINCYDIAGYNCFIGHFFLSPRNFYNVMCTSVATRYGLESPAIKFRQKARFFVPPRPTPTVDTGVFPREKATKA
jgi:hypothetical protein